MQVVAVDVVQVYDVGTECLGPGYEAQGSGPRVQPVAVGQARGGQMHGHVGLSAHAQQLRVAVGRTAHGHARTHATLACHASDAFRYASGHAASSGGVDLQQGGRSHQSSR